MFNLNSDRIMRTLDEKINGVVVRVIENAISEYKAHERAWPYDFADAEAREVMAGMLARQISLMRHLSCSPACWNWDIAPLFLRPMVEVVLNMAWIAKDPNGRSRSFIAYGLGQEKLQVEHMKATLSGMDAEDQEEYSKAIEHREHWIAEQCYPYLVEVNVGSWAESQFKMAQETGELSLYHHCYAPFSGCVHSMWHHVARYNLDVCKNPLHRHHRIANLTEIPGDFHSVYLAVKYLHRAFKVLQRAFDLKVKHQSTFALLRREINELNRSDSAEPPKE